MKGGRNGGGTTPRSTVAIAAVWTATRAVTLLWVFRVVVPPGPDVTSDVSVIYRGWYEVLRTGTYPISDVTWQYPPAAALAILSPGVLPFLDYVTAFLVLVAVCDAAVLGLLLAAARRPGRSVRGVWVWVAGVPLLGPTAYARYDLMVTAVAVAALLAGVRRPRAMGALVAFGALLKVWPVLLLAGVARARVWWSAALAAAVVLTAAAGVPGAFGFLTHQRDRGTEVESLGALVFHIGRLLGGWDGRVLLNYGSIEFLGPYVSAVSAAALLLAAGALGWLMVWRLRAGDALRRLARDPAVVADAALTAVLLFITTSRVISPQYLLWPVGVAAVCLLYRPAGMTGPAVLVLLASAVTTVEFPLLFDRVVASDPVGVLLLLVRNGLLVAATVWAGRRLWRATAPGPVRPVPDVAVPVTPAAAADSRASGW
ncbi:glycosyltransferase 87 family protein [Streptomyces sp. NPDC059248]|uniref:glycosyltransferase 87 family protein n=1 Tax=Streptomyces sp. NPDC059248 TaxID=3346791 RepID=UPI003694E685